ncbi:hypothetical protein FH972_019037 [Carpinus fangiana]|uniref:Uncharacterized protein n=1 Tax=Carpinus fangiana TaxID=176857 RepID=A0A5N6RP21_9ROSI|nr:hypothetical protein FH972_019037 [Carpinus fangiana]
MGGGEVTESYAMESAALDHSSVNKRQKAFNFNEYKGPTLAPQVQETVSAVRTHKCLDRTVRRSPTVDGGDGVFVEATEGDETDRPYRLYGDNRDKETNRRREEKEEES